MLKKDHYILGLLIGIIAPGLLYGLIFGANVFLLNINVARIFLDQPTHILISLFSNLLLLRYYFVNLKFDKTGRGILIITFVSILVFFAFKDYISL